MGKKNKKLQGSAVPRQPDIRLSFKLPQRPKMAPVACVSPEASEASIEEEESLPSPRLDARSYMPETEEDEAPTTKGDIKKILVEMRQVWREDLQKVQTDVEAGRRIVQGLETHEASRDGKIRATDQSLLELTSQVQDLRCTVTTMEARQRHKNLRLRGVPESVENTQLLHYVQDLTAAMGVKSATDKMQITTAFRVRKAATAPSEAPRDIIVVT
ncbi:Hypothetical predicted protein [Pelobates cultripes]|uniref:Uncharacterized protein n=1 Tax=Pelobates cultripes TaxID=61616 RepID=A0AAD1VKR7_PELCU|nr:Hypothetical predicted protein [Pelobates cultripes]